MATGRLTERLARSLGIAGRMLAARQCEADGITLLHPAEPWYFETAPEMLRLLAETRTRLEEGLELTSRRELACVVADPQWALETLGVAGLALESVIVVACRPRRLSEFARTAAHELAHVLSRSRGAYERPCKGEGFACYAAEVIDADTRPCGLPLHYHLVWMLSVGLRPSLPGLWERRDYTAELYDLGWSFTTFVVETFGLESFYRLYGARDTVMETRVREGLGLSRAKLERLWYDAAAGAVDADGRAISRVRRGPGLACGRAAWLGSR